MRTPILTFDIETLPDMREGARERALSRLKPPATYTKPESIQKWIDENAEEAYLKTALNGGYGSIHTIAWKLVGDDQVHVASMGAEINKPSGELTILQDFWNFVRSLRVSPIWVGHNIQKFDLPFLFQRSVINGCIPKGLMPHRNNIHDTMAMWTQVWNGYISLKELKEILDIPIDPTEIDGKDVWKAIQDGRHEDVIKHCMADVKNTEEIYLMLT